MSRASLMSIFLANREQREQFAEDLAQPMMQYFSEAEEYADLEEHDIRAYRKFVRQHPPQTLYEDYKQEAKLEGFDLPKCNLRAAKLRQDGNKLYAKKDYNEALTKYNESICCALGDSEDLSIGFANRSAVCFEMEEYEFALANIQLAKRHNYPQRLMPKLEARERNCRAKIEAGENQFPNKRPKLIVNVETNRTIPFLANGVVMAEYPRVGRGMKSERDFKVGDVILQERPVIVAVDPVFSRYDTCYHCGSETLMSMVPCPHCVSVMYCGEECVRNNWQSCHRFECGIHDKLSIVNFGPYSVGPKVFFYGLTQFKDDVSDMMEYCKAHGRKGSNPFELDYTKSGPMDVFKQFHTAKVAPLCKSMSNFMRFAVAILYDIYIEHPLVQSLFPSEKERNFLMESIADYMTMSFRIAINHSDDTTIHMFPLASICNHSCDPNAHAVNRSGELRIIVVRPIAKSEQICVPYRVVIGEVSDFHRFREIASKDFDCVCEVCDPNKVGKWLNGKDVRHPPVFHRHLEVVWRILEDASCTNLDKINAVQQFAQRYAYVHPLADFRKILEMYRTILQKTFDNDMIGVLRRRALKAGNGI